MPRRTRSHVPGGVFHLTTRLHDKAHLFDDSTKDVVTALTVSALDRSDVEMLAFVVMSNHLHFVVRQGASPLSEFMQPLLRRIALSVHRLHGRTNQVFGNRYFAKLCMNPAYLRDVIVYTHLNPCRAGLHDAPELYPWSSHAVYASAEPPYSSPLCHRVSSAVDVFRGTETHVGAGTAYLRYVRYRMSCDADPEQARAGISHPDTSAGDLYWQDRFTAPQGWALTAESSALRPDLRDLAARLAARMAPGVPLDVLRRRHCGKMLSSTRNDIIWELLDVGHTCVAVSRFFGVSQARVSQIGARHWTALRDHLRG